MDQQRRVVLSLAAAQALFQTCPVLVVTVGGLAGLSLAPSPALATLPVACMPVGALIATLPASLLMGRIGRRPGFVLGSLIGALGGATAALAMVNASFVLLCAGILLIGAHNGFAQFYRFAAAEAASDDFRSRAISLVTAGGVVAAVAGPNLGAWSRNAFEGAAYAGSFAVVTALSLMATTLLAMTPLPHVRHDGVTGGVPRPVSEIARQPRFRSAVISAAVGAAVMTLVMTATPLSMVAHDHDLADAAFVIQWHVLGMFLPSFFTGWLIRRLGYTTMLLAGVGALGCHIVIALTGQHLINYVSGLVLLGIGWNFLYVGGSSLLTETYRPSEKAKVQGLNDFLIVGLGAGASLSAGALTETFGWRGLNLAAAPLLLIAATAVLTARKRRPATPN